VEEHHPAAQPRNAGGRPLGMDGRGAVHRRRLDREFPSPPSGDGRGGELRILKPGV
jgi:hypothetical protein